MAVPGNLTAYPIAPGVVPRPVPAYVLARSLAASTAESISVPTVNGVQARYVIFSSNCDFYVNGYTTATVPGDTTDGTASELNPAGYAIPADVTTLSVITAASSGIVTAAFYA